MICKTIDKIIKVDILALITDGIAEIKTIEYKAELPKFNDEGKKEFLADITSFANAAGGDILFGIKAEKGIPKDAVGVGIDKAKQDELKLKLESIIRDSIESRIIPAIQMEFVSGFEKGPVLIIRVPKSWAAPHMVGPKNSSRFYSRNSAGKYPLDCSEIRSAFSLSESLTARIQQFRNDRLAKIIAGETPVLLEGKSRLVLHILPVSSFTSDTSIDAKLLFDQAGTFEPMFATGLSRRINFDGCVTFDRSGNTSYTYCQIFRRGQLEAVSGSFFVDNDGKLFLPHIAYEKELIESVKKFTAALNAFQVFAPLFISITLLGVKGVALTTRNSFTRYTAPIDRQNLILPELMVEDYGKVANDNDIARLLRPALDSVWNACGEPWSINFNKDGNWSPT